VDQAAIDNAGSGGPDNFWNHLSYRPADGTWLLGAQTGNTYKVTGGYAYRQVKPSGQSAISVDQADMDNSGKGGPDNIWNHLAGVR
jgi:hypothetical protein